MKTLAAILVVGLAGCASTGAIDAVPVPEHTVTEYRVFVPIDKELTAPCPIASRQKLSDAPAVAAQRKAALEVCNAQLAAIAAIQGTPVTPPKKDEK